MWAQMGPLFWGARFSGHPQAQMHSSGDPKSFNPFGKMDMGDRGSHYGHHPFNKPGPAAPSYSSMSSSSSSKGSMPRNAHSNYDGLGASNHYASHLNDYHHHNGGHYGMSSSSSSSSSYKHKSDISGDLYSGYGNPNHAHQGSNGAYSQSSNVGLPSMPPMVPSSPQAPPLPPPSNVPPTRSQSPPSKQPGQERLKKCKAVFGQGQKELWCNKCRWKKKCIRWDHCFRHL